MRRLAKTPPLQAERLLDARLPQIETVRLYRQIADLLSERIDQGLFPIGTLLPAERDLAQQLGVSRTSVREALIALEVGGKVSIRVGHGVQILEATPRSVAGERASDLADADIGPIQLMEARRHVELKTAELAAANRTDGTVSGYTIVPSTTTAALSLTPLSGSPYTSGSAVQALGVDSTGKYLLAVAVNGGPDLTMYSFDITVPGKLDPSTSVATGTDPAGAVALALTH